MFYETETNEHGLKHNPFKALVAPRPIGWISTVSTDGVVNLAPYSFFNGVSDIPPFVMFSSAGQKDSQRNAEETGEFVCSLATYDLREHMNTTSAGVGPEVDEMDLAGLTPAPSKLVKPPRVAESPVALECKHFQSIALPAAEGRDPYSVVLGHVVGIHIDESVLNDGLVDMQKLRPIARLGYMDYTVVETVFSMDRP
ncbi:MAG: flavin reductase family protein [Hyphomicrobiaceae bacterium]|nr:flavin reductase family protein [Hyphomicrobiaceae bacterium]